MDLGMMGWAEFKSMKLPLWEVLTGIAVSVGITWAAFAWADEIKDKQAVTQTQLDQLVTIVSTSTNQNNEVHQQNRADINQIQTRFELLQQEVKLRRELEREASSTDGS